MTTTTTTAAPSVTELLASVERIRPIIEEHAPQSEADRKLSPAIYDAMLEAGLFRMLVPTAFGGYQMSPVDAYKVWEAVARIDAAAGWCLQISAAAGEFAAWLPAQGAAEFYADRGADTVVASGFLPPAALSRVPGGFRVSGQQAFASGSSRADWYLAPCIEMADGEPVLDAATGAPTMMMAAIPRADIEVVDTWNTVGMRGTGSNDVVLRDVFVPDHRATPVGIPTTVNPAFDPAMVALPPWPGVHGEAVVSLGVACAAIDKLVALAQTKVPNFTTKTLCDREMAQHHVAKAQALVDSSREYLHASAREAYAEAAGCARLSIATKTRLQLAACLVAENCAEATRLVHEAAGTSGIRIEAGFERHLRDALTMSQHGSKSYGRYEDTGKLIFGVPCDWFPFAL